MKRILTVTFATFCPIVLLLSGTTWAAGDAAAGKVIFDANCASCHGVSGKGDGPVGAALTPHPRDFTVGEFKFDADGSGTPGDDEDLVLVIQNGAMKFGGSPLMAPWPTLTPEQVSDIIAHIRSLKASGDAPAADAAPEAPAS